MRPSTAVLLQFNQLRHPEEVRVGIYDLKWYTPKLLPCFRCSRYGDLAKNNAKVKNDFSRMNQIGNAFCNVIITFLDNSWIG